MVFKRSHAERETEKGFVVAALGATLVVARVRLLNGIIRAGTGACPMVVF
ncbi:conserved hypothetical protein [delta proteobacterium NaphS2]|nr:conserved hypothetical protein [delta proteobacterium NaphS2]